MYVLDFELHQILAQMLLQLNCGRLFDELVASPSSTTMIKGLFTTVSLFTMLTMTTRAMSQDFLGLSMGNYSGVTGVMLQPASIVDSRHRFDINLFSVGTNYSNNYLLVNRNAILKFNKNNFSSYPVFKDKYLTRAELGANEKVFFNVNNRTQLPLSFMATTGKKSAIALNIQSRSMVQGRNITQALANAAYGEFYPNANTGNIDASGFSINTLNWAEVGFTYGRVLFSSNKHFLKAAVTAKYLGGVSSLNMSSTNLRLGINADSSFNFTTSNTQYNHNQNAGFNNIFDRNFKPDESGFGYDAGLVYEFRGNIDKFRYISYDDQKSYVADRRDANKYMIRLGVSLLDAGRFTFSKPANVNSFSSAITGWRLRDQAFKTLSNFDTALANRVTPLPNDARNYNVYLPAALSVQLDIRFIKGFYLNVMTYNAVKMGDEPGFRFDKYDYYTITPRWESRAVGIYIPYTFGNHKNLNNYKGNLLGATLRLGPLFIGSSNLGTMAFNKNLKAADVHAGLKIGFTYGKPTKASRLLDKVTSKNKMVLQNDTLYTTTVRDSTTMTTRQKPATQPPVIIDYKNGQIFSESSRNGNIIIVNNNYYYGSTQQAPQKDTTINETIISRLKVDTLYLYRTDSAVTVITNNTRAVNAADTMPQRLKDSLDIKKRQLDSLINNLQQLRKEMDTTQARNVLDTTIIKNKKTAAKASKQMQGDTLRMALNKKDALINKLRDSLIVQNRLVSQKKDSLPVILKKEKDIKKTINEPLATTQYSPRQEGIVLYDTNSANKRAKEINDKRELDFKRYAYESNKLQQEIKALQNDLKRERRTNTQTNYKPVYLPAQSQPQAISKTDTVYLRDTVNVADTVLIADTVVIKDTVTNIRIHTDTILKSVSPAAQIVYVPVETETILIKPDIKNIPTELLMFGVGQSAIRPIYNKKLNYLSTLLKKDTQLYANITGFTDATGSLKINRILALKRANSVKNYFILKGVSQGQLIVKGETADIPTSGNKKASTQQRRVEIKITGSE